MRLVLLGFGAINTRVAALLAQRRTPVQIVGIAVSAQAKARPPMPPGAELLTAPDQLAAARTDLIVEAAGRSAVVAWLPHALRHAKTTIVASTSAFCDDAFLDRMRALAETSGSRIVIPSGAIGALDALAAAAILELDEVVHEIVKPPKAWLGTKAEKAVDLAALRERTIVFDGSAREAASAYPQNANSTVVTSLAGIGLDKTVVRLVADPAVTMNGHRIIARGAFGSLELKLDNNPLATNPKSSELTALSLVRLIERQLQPVVV
ncbi:MAG TPA: aspartate dehydrogenase [Pseudolabrys sp.]|nr:aspartate dehydrogenase [Pseudolabrys sp.]